MMSPFLTTTEFSASRRRLKSSWATRMFMEAEDRRRLSLMELSVGEKETCGYHCELCVTHRGRIRVRSSCGFSELETQAWNRQSPESSKSKRETACTQIKEFLQLLSAECHVSVTAEVHAAECQDVVELLADDLQSLRVTHQVVHGPEGGGSSVPHRCPEHSKMMS